MKINKPKILIKITDKNKEVKRVGSRRRRHIYQFLKANNFGNCIIKVKVSYEKGFANQGAYKNNAEAINALQAFLEAEL